MKSISDKVDLNNVRVTSPFALPAVFGNVLQRRVQAVGVVADVTVVTKQEAAWICGLPTGLTHRALQAAPAFTQHHLVDLGGRPAGVDLLLYV